MPQIRVDDKILLKVLEQEDADAVFSLVDENRLYLREWLPWVDTNTTKEDSRIFIKSTQEQNQLNFGFQCGIWFNEYLAGIIGFHPIDWVNKSVEIGYWLGKKFQGNGIVTKSCKALVEVAFYDFQLNRVQIRCATENKKSCAIIERLGFIREGTIRQAEFLYDKYVDLHIYGITADIWKERYGQHANNAGT
jgi:ribosomal-protein-serine acetyltransferase